MGTGRGERKGGLAGAGKKKKLCRDEDLKMEWKKKKKAQRQNNT